jgi:hypothetical protein
MPGIGMLLQGGIPGKKAVGDSLNSANRNQKNFQIRSPTTFKQTLDAPFKTHCHENE